MLKLQYAPVIQYYVGTVRSYRNLAPIKIGLPALVPAVRDLTD